MHITKDWESETDKGFLLPVGKYDFEVAKAEDGVSNAGNEKITLSLHVHDGKGGKVYVTDWLTPAFKKNVVDFCRCVGLGELVTNEGELKAVRCLQRTGVVLLKQEQYKTDAGETRTVNRVERYDYETPQKTPEGDDIPF